VPEAENGGTSSKSARHKKPGDRRSQVEILYFELRARQEIVESACCFRTGWDAVMIDHNPNRERFAALSQHLDERSRRVFAAAEAKAAGYGGIAAVWRATGIAPSTINRGLKELAEDLDPALRQVRRPGVDASRWWSVMSN
jgi:hypothetical protein